MGCLIVVLGAAFPRLALFFTWLFTDRISTAFDGGWALPMLGFFILPFTTFFYVVADANGKGVSAIGWFFVLMGFLFDLGVLGGGGRENNRRRQST
jgi:hypothetical protein